MEAKIYDAIKDTHTTNIDLGGIEHVQPEHDGIVRIYFDTDWSLIMQPDEVRHILEILSEEDNDG